jgi:hypothetical protein
VKRTEQRKIAAIAAKNGLLHSYFLGVFAAILQH